MKSLLFGLGISLLASNTMAAEKSLSLYYGTGKDTQTTTVFMDLSVVKGLDLNVGASLYSTTKLREDGMIFASLDKEVSQDTFMGNFSLDVGLGLEQTLSRFDDLGQSGFRTHVFLEYEPFSAVGFGVGATFHAPFVDKSYSDLGIVFSNRF